MDIMENIKSGATFIADTASEFAESISEKNRIRQQMNHLKKFIKNQTATRDQAYMELGRYFFENLREGASPENEALCAVIDETTAGISKASLKYMDLVNLQNETKIRSENAEKLKKIVAEKANIAAQNAKAQGAELAEKAKAAAAEGAKKAKEAAASGAQKAKDFAADTAQKAKDAAADLREKAAEKSFDIKEFTVEKAEEIKEKTENMIDEVKEKAEEIKETAAEKKDAAADDIGKELEKDAESAYDSDDIETLIAAEQERLKTAEQSAVTESAPPASSADEESPENFEF